MPSKPSPVKAKAKKKKAARKRAALLGIADLKSMKHALAGESESRFKEKTKLISRAAISRIIRAAGARRVSGDITRPVKTDLAKDKFGIVHQIFRDTLDDLSEKAIFITIGEKMKTLLPRHVEQLGVILGVHDLGEGLPHVAVAPIRKRIQKRSHKELRLNPEAVKMLVALTLDRTIRHLRSGVGLAAHENDRLTVNTRDVRNAEAICQNFPQS